jgi:hypothetical protein
MAKQVCGQAVFYVLGKHSRVFTVDASRTAGSVFGGASGGRRTKVCTSGLRINSAWQKLGRS